MRCWMMCVILSIAAAATIQPVRGQMPLPTSLPADAMLNQMLQPESASQPSAAHGQSPSMFPQGLGPKSTAGRLVREGSEIVDRTGILHHASGGNGDQIFFPGDANTPALTITALPDLQLMSMENAQAETTRDLRFVVSGIVTEYKGKNYILLEARPDESDRLMPPSLLVKHPSAASAPEVSPGSHAAGAQPALPAEQILNQMLVTSPKVAPVPRAATMAPMIDRTTGDHAIAPGAPAILVRREGSQIIDRVGHLTHTPDGMQPQFSFDSDGSAMEDPPLIILPNLKLAIMENSVQAQNKDLRFRVTGMVTEYRGRNYILLQKAVVIPETTQQF